MNVAELLQYERHAVDAGEWWRVLTSHFVHWSVDQAIWDALTFAALASIAIRRWPSRFGAAVIASAIAIPLTIHFAMPQVMTYRGLSGLGSALFALIATRMLMTRRNPFVVACAAAFAIKITYEFVSGDTLFVQSLGPGVVALPIAHVIGAICGVLAAITPPVFPSARSAHSSTPRPILPVAARAPRAARRSVVRSMLSKAPALR
jgi:rhomboid family GlyGly-CTERM serine protease